MILHSTRRFSPGNALGGERSIKIFCFRWRRGNVECGALQAGTAATPSGYKKFYPGLLPPPPAHEPKGSLADE